MIIKILGFILVLLVVAAIENKRHKKNQND